MPRLKRFLSEVKQGIVPQTLLLHTNVGNTQEAKKELLEYVNFQETENVLNSVKPTRLLCHLLKIGTKADSEDIVLDFFAGSGGLGHSVVVQNVEDEGRRRYIMVQLPEVLPKEEPGLKTISDLAQIRMKTVHQKLLESDNVRQKNIDLGFRKFRLDSSNIRAWNPDRNDLEQTLIDHLEHLVEGRSEEDVLYELLLKRGVDLTVPIEDKSIIGKTVYSIGYGVLFACLDKSISCEQIEDLAMGIISWHKGLEPASDTQVVFRDSAFASDIAKTNMTSILGQHGIAHVRSL